MKLGSIKEIYNVRDEYIKLAEEDEIALLF